MNTVMQKLSPQLPATEPIKGPMHVLVWHTVDSPSPILKNYTKVIDIASPKVIILSGFEMNMLEMIEYMLV